MQGLLPKLGTPADTEALRKRLSPVALRERNVEVESLLSEALSKRLEAEVEL